ncbi:tRNA (adenosine(37)-N6)-dimethylallyltransferase MiaA [Mycetocola tolaasinivorans]|uniref:tRNA dimethylallyltransferase n=1 Tax=Mycetocola tolaasinivorans TaxID=76635 RepID=A0A3L7ACL6_9MICO|nr:tRNA (adenosine(37)-N6)-dimethylallyltransferase MiaA [Mycetocola tolaasinivorans]RLP78103.1 tRNA (adenosine(37)-N6)-dimethylallyltransferase MiaA [Mycetocola tolaasinivorans]
MPTPGALLGDLSAPRLIAVVGATGTGKSDLSLELARRLAAHGQAAEIVNVDAMQFYRGMDIGTAKVSAAERAEFPHHLFDILDPHEDAAVAHYQPEARGIIADILARGAWPILVGGSGLYVSSVLFDFDFPGQDPEVRARLEAELSEQGPGLLYRRLRELSPEAAERIGPHNGRRIVRALEVAEITGTPVAGTLPEEPTWWTPTLLISLTAPREDLVARLDARVTRMWEAGLLAETAGLLAAGIDAGITARRAIGYGQAAAELRGEMTEAEAIEDTRRLTRRYARRQVSWFKRYQGAHVFDTVAEPLPAIADHILPTP